MILRERSERSSSNHAGTLPRLVADVLEGQDGLTRDDVLAVTIGPGSFTGLRIALSFAKGLAFAGGQRLIGVPTLDALAVTAPAVPGRLCAALDARKREVYAAIYERTDGRLVRVGGPWAIAADRLVGAVGRPCTFIGNAVESYGDLFRAALGGDAHVLSSTTLPPSAVAVARLAAGRLRRAIAGDDLATLAPSYVRPPEAELTQSAHSPSAAPAALEFVDKVPIVY